MPVYTYSCFFCWVKSFHVDCPALFFSFWPVGIGEASVSGTGMGELVGSDCQSSFIWEMRILLASLQFA